MTSPVLVGLFPQRPPDDLLRRCQSAEGGIFTTCFRQHRNEAAMMLMDIGHVLAGGQLRIGNVEKIAPAGQLAEQIPGVTMRGVVGNIATGPHESAAARRRRL